MSTPEDQATGPGPAPGTGPGTGSAARTGARARDAGAGPSPGAEQRLVLGVDAGGTAVRAVLTDLTGRRLGEARGGGGNPQAQGGPAAAERIGEAIGAALGDHDPDRLAACVIGLAGYRRFATDAAAVAFTEQCRTAAGPAVPGHLRLSLRPDAEVAFAAGTAAPDGVVLIAGTGAVACRLQRRRVSSVRGGQGWLLGDEGSGFWLGREAARHALDTLGSPSGAPDALTTAVLAVLGVPARPRAGAVAGLLGAVYDAPATAPAALAPLVSAAAAAGDEAAARIAARAAAHLGALLESALPAGAPPEPIVLAGAVAASPGPVRDALTAVLAGLPGRVVVAGDTTMAAAWLAARTVVPGTPHEAFLP
ncbi:N-acetylglucosamine kinase [Kitasatospora herbaricolor]|uniref:ATPase BadF/BadG/BcrA/BcrD type domain-containing protein n=1 Tax=Kitasatospora herbaricolor TaxID=68217 RepID=A0ABZ1W6M1_9ACTN|nr:BadF/BadG/BcrA/BcrD ATPase family protein [Kitasatospora herbaricolor]